MAEPVSVAQLEAHLRLPVGGSGEADYLSTLITAARRTVEKHTASVIVGDAPTLGDDDRAIASQAIMMLAGHWYYDREAGDGLPKAVEAMIWPLTRLAI
jgi:hypothetical protein